MGLNVLMESKGGKKKSSSSKTFYEAPLGYSIEDVRPNGGIKKFRSAAYSNVSFSSAFILLYIIQLRIPRSVLSNHLIKFLQCARKPS